MSYLTKLREYLIETGVVDIDICEGTNMTSVEDVCETIYKALTAKDFEDITNKDL